MQIQGIGATSLLHGQEKTSKSLDKTNRDLDKILKRLSTAMRINQASDDAAGLGISEQLRTQIRGFQTAARNVSDASSALSIADGAGNEISSLLTRQRTLALQASSDTLSDTQRKGIDVEYQALTSEIDRISGSTQFNSQNLTNGQGLGAGNAEVQAGANPGDQIQMPAINMSAATLGITGTSVTDSAQAKNAVSKLDNALGSLNSQRSQIGTMINRFESVGNNLSIAEINTQAAESVLRDQDMAAGLAEMARQKLLLEGGTQSFARFNQISVNSIMGLIK